MPLSPAEKCTTLVPVVRRRPNRRPPTHHGLGVWRRTTVDFPARTLNLGFVVALATR